MESLTEHTILLIEDSQLVGKRLIEMIQDIPSVKIIKQAVTLKEGYELINKHSPNIVLLDISLPDGNGLEILKYVSERSLNTKVIVVSNSGEFYQKKALSLGAYNFLDKTKDFPLLGDVIKSIIQQ